MSERGVNYDRMLVVGMPASGKSTLIDGVVRRFQREGIDCRVVDDFLTLRRICSEGGAGERYHYDDQNNLVIEPQYQAEIMREMFLALGNEVGRADEFIIWEMTSPRLSKVLTEYFEKFVSEKTLVVWVDCGYDLASQRNLKRVGHVIPDSYMTLFRSGREENIAWLKENFPKMLLVDNTGSLEKMAAVVESIFMTLSE